MRYIKVQYFFIPIFLFFVFSCASKKDFHYLQDVETYSKASDSTFNNVKIQKNDLLSIIVSSTDQKSAIPFNLPVVASSNSSLSLSVSSRQEMQTYLVGEEGTINFPILGEIFVLDKTKEQLVKDLKSDLMKYIKNPIITLRIMNFKISVMGQVNKPGTFSIDNERITIMQALSLAGDMTIFGKRKDVLVIREENGKKTFNRLDFTSKDVLLSPYYYLRQNDVIIVEGNNALVQSSAFNRNTSIFVSVAGIIISVISIIASNN